MVFTLFLTVSTCPVVLCNSVSAQPLVRRTHMEYTHLAIGHGAARTYGFGASSRLAHKTALVFGEHIYVCVIASIN